MELANGGGLELFFNTSGDCVLQPIADPATAQVSWSYDEGAVDITTKLARNLTRATAANYVVRDGQGSGVSVPVRGLAQDSDPTSPTWTGGKYGIYVDYKSSNLYTTQAQAQAAANADLRLALGSVETLAISSIPKPDMDVDNVIEVTRTRVGMATSSFFVVDGFTLGLGPQATLDATCRRVNRTSSAPAPA